MDTKKSDRKFTRRFLNFKLSAKSILLSIILLFLIIIVPSSYFVKGQGKLPQPTSLKYINDYVGIVDDESKNYIQSLGKELESKTGAQMTAVVINSLEGRDVESYTNELFRTWGIGQKDKDNGLLILLSIQDKKWRVEVGRGLEGAVTDIYSSRVMDSVAKPLFAKGSFGEGIRDVYTVFSGDIAKEYNVTLENKRESVIVPKENSKKVDLTVVYIILAAFLGDIIFNKSRITRFIFRILFWNSFFGNGGGRNGGGFGGGGFGGGGSGGFGGGGSGGGGSSGGW